MQPNSWLGVQFMKAFPPPRELAAYDPGLRTLHWVMAALIFVALPLGVWASLLPSGGAMRVEILFFHKSMGVTVFGLIALRIVWRPVAQDQNRAVSASWAPLVFAWMLAFVLATHLSAVVWHAMIKRDSVLTRMWPSFRPASSSGAS